MAREGSDVTLVTLSQMVQKALLAAEELAREGISVEGIDLRTLAPLDREAVLRSVGKTGVLLVAGTLCHRPDGPLLCDAMGSPADAAVLHRRTVACDALAGRPLAAGTLASATAARTRR